MSNGGQLDAASSASQIRATCAEMAKKFMQQIEDAQSEGDYTDEEYWKQQLAIVLEELVRSTH